MKQARRAHFYNKTYNRRTMKNMIYNCSAWKNQGEEKCAWLFTEKCGSRAGCRSYLKMVARPGDFEQHSLVCAGHPEQSSEKEQYSEWIRVHDDDKSDKMLIRKNQSFHE